MDLSRLPKGSWNGTFRSHVLLLENFLSPLSSKPGGEICVYLAGLIARRLDEAYSSACLSFILEDPSEIDGIVRSHQPYIGQNAPIVTISKINAEFLSFALATKGDQAWRSLEILAPKKLFSLASVFSYRCGNAALGNIFGVFSTELDLLLNILGAYLRYIEENPDRFPPATLSENVSERFSEEINERNRYKERNPGAEDTVPYDAQVDPSRILGGWNLPN
ncbi:hypothetical protein EHO60_01905 [Leptospira fletcheri]|uniref:Uncharacterized protein n=1 Tax=Leptospira fletcheri TaxID=2484981 RepID=A0A4R9GK43_9LEPT|nr:hypothetical protein [Leptospira fletcheri]TGK14122.1 hypothetical protein EHO60_01905 [Leptospira fletcheri]